MNFNLGLNTSTNFSIVLQEQYVPAILDDRNFNILLRNTSLFNILIYSEPDIVYPTFPQLVFNLLHTTKMKIGAGHRPITIQ